MIRLFTHDNIYIKLIESVKELLNANNNKLALRCHINRDIKTLTVEKQHNVEGIGRCAHKLRARTAIT